MDHADALERIEIAAAEPDGLDRLMAGDTPDAAQVAGHLAGCEACVAELGRIRHTADVVRGVVRSAVDPSLRGRTLAFVREVGVERRRGGVSVIGSDRAPNPARVSGSRRSRAGAWAAALVATGAVAAVLGFAFAGLTSDARLRVQADEVATLERATVWSLRLDAQPDARRVELASADGSSRGSLVFSAGTGELLVVAEGLGMPAAGQEYGCWVEVDGQRRRLGRMYFGGALATWAGPAAGLADLPPGAVFGVSLGPEGGGGDATPVLTGRL